MIDYLIVGQGLAGTWLSHYLMKAGKKVMVVDQVRAQSASLISSGIINPITGHKHLKSWKIDQLLDHARKAYREMEHSLSSNFVKDFRIVWILREARHINSFNERSIQKGYTKYVEKVSGKAFSPLFHKGVGHAVVKGGLVVQTAKMMNAYRQHLKSLGALREDQLMYSDIQIEETGVQWKDIQAKQVVFCEGYYGQDNPWFSWLPFKPAKGEILIIHAPELQLSEHIIKDRSLIVPLGDDHYWIGSTYTWDALDEITTEEGKNELIRRFERTSSVPYTVVHHWAGVRPASKSRRPFAGIHPSIPQLAIFNGLGTKGVSLSAWFAKEMCDHLVFQKELDREIQLGRHFNPA